MTKKVEISYKTIVFTVLFLLALLFLYTIRDIIMQFFVALLIMTILNPSVTKLSKRGIPRAVSVLVVYLIALSLIVISFAGLIPQIVDQTAIFINRLPFYVDNIGLNGSFGDQLLQELVSILGSIPGQLARFTVSVFSNLLSVFIVLVLAFYLLLARNKLDNQLGFLFEDGKKASINKIIDQLEHKLGGWARGQLALMSLVAVSTLIGLLVLGFPYAIPLAVLAGLFEIIPYVGPLISAIPAVLIGFGISPFMGIAAIILYFLVQQMENYFFAPKVMEKSVGVNPVVTILSLAIGFRMAGIVGILIAIPVVILVEILIKNFFEFDKK